MKGKMYSPVYVFSDCHIGSGQFGVQNQALARDNFEIWGHSEDLFHFLDFLDDGQYGSSSVVIIGDFFEFWQASVGDVLAARKDLLDRLADFGRGDLNRLRYVPGNHDVDLRGLINETGEIGNAWLKHPFFSHMVHPFTERIGSRYYHFIHGHEGDVFNKSTFPEAGWIASVLAALVEDKVGSPYFDKALTKSVEGSLSAVGDKIAGFFNWLGNGLIRRKGESKTDKVRSVDFTPDGPDGYIRETLELERRYFESLDAVDQVMEDGSGIQKVAHGGQGAKFEDDIDRLAVDYLSHAWLDYAHYQKAQSALRSSTGNKSGGRGTGATAKANILQMAKYRLTLDHNPIIICGHTHVSGRHEDWYYNSGCWINRYGEVIRITGESGPELFEWRGDSLNSRAWRIL